MITYSILAYSVINFITQIVFIGFRTWNVKAISQGNTLKALLSGAIVHVAWLVSIAIGAVSMHQIMNDFHWKYIPIVCCSLVGGLIGTYIAMREKTKKKQL